MSILKKATLATALVASTLVSVAPASARDHYRHRGNDTAGIAVGAGILGLAIGAIAASDGRDRRYRDDRYYDGGSYYYRDGYYWDRDGRRYDRDSWRRENRWDRDGSRGGYRDDGRRGYQGEYYYRRGY